MSTWKANIRSSFLDTENGGKDPVAENHCSIGFSSDYSFWQSPPGHLSDAEE